MHTLRDYLEPIRLKKKNSWRVLLETLGCPIENRWDHCRGFWFLPRGEVKLCRKNKQVGLRIKKTGFFYAPEEQNIAHNYDLDRWGQENGRVEIPSLLPGGFK